MATSTIALERPVASTPAPGRGTMGRLARQRGAIVGLMVLGTLVVLAVGAPLLNSRDPIKTSVRDALQPPGPRFVLGSDQFGRDVASRVLHGTRISLTVGLIAVSIAALLGAPIGLVAGYYGGWLDGIVMCVIDVLLAFPGILLALAIVSVLTSGLTNVMIAVCSSSVPSYSLPVQAIVLTVLGMNLLGDALRDVLDPRLKTSSADRSPQAADGLAGCSKRSRCEAARVAAPRGVLSVR